MAGTAGQQFLDTIASVNAPAPATMADYQAEADRLSFLMPQTRKPTI